MFLPYFQFSQLLFLAIDKYVIPYYYCILVYKLSKKDEANVVLLCNCADGGLLACKQICISFFHRSVKENELLSLLFYNLNLLPGVFFLQTVVNEDRNFYPTRSIVSHCLVNETFIPNR